jgi:ubiquinone/menaquinone biosynthesis C-methylase UbiE
LIQADAQSLPFGENEFDAGLATLVFCSIPEPEMAFAELQRVVRTGGKIVLLEHVRPDGLMGRAFDLLNVATVALIDDHFNRRTVEIAENSGLKIVEERKKLGGVVNLIVCEV